MQWSCAEHRKKGLTRAKHLLRFKIQTSQQLSKREKKEKHTEMIQKNNSQNFTGLIVTVYQLNSLMTTERTDLLWPSMEHFLMLSV